MVAEVKTSNQHQQLLREAVHKLPKTWTVTPVDGNKRPYRSAWQNESPLSVEDLTTEINSGRAKGYGLRTGVVSGGILAIDADGHSAHEKIIELSGGQPLPHTVTFTSNRPGRCQYLFYVPEEYWPSIKTTKIKTGVTGDDGKLEQLELRWDGCQSVLPPSIHPETGFYRWVKSPEEIAIAPAPMWVIEKMLIQSEPVQEKPHREPTRYTQKLRTGEEWSALEWALSFLSALSPSRADDYDDWLAVGMALHSVHDSLLTEWDNWSRQSSKYVSGECEKKWKSFKSGNVSIAWLGKTAKQDGWRSPFEKSSGRAYSNSNLNQNRRKSDGSGGGDGNQPLSVLSLRDRILEILNRNQDRSQRDEAFINLAQTTGVATKEVKELAASLESEVDVEESRSDRKAEVENLLRIGKYQLELQDYLALSVAQPLERVARWMGTTPAAMLTTLYPVIGSLLKVGTRLELIKATDFYALPVVYAGIVCESGAGKTPAQKTLLKPLFALQTEAEVEYKERLNEYQQELAEWKKKKDNDEPAPEQPVPREYYTTDATSEAIALIQSQQPGFGFLGWFDELPSLFKSQGQYKNGRGADSEKILSGRDGTGFKVNRASGKRLVVDQSAYSIIGALQLLILRQMMGDFTDANGQWARFLWTVMPVQPAPYPDDAIPFNISGLLKGIYKRIEALPAVTYKLSPKAQKLYRNWYNELDQLRITEPRQGLRAVYSKMKGDTGVLALLLHCFNSCVVEGSVPDLEINESTMVAAIKLAKFHIGQVKLIHSEGDAANGELAAIHTKIIQLSERKGWLKAADVRDIDRQSKKQFSANDIRKHFRELEATGFGQTKGEGPRLMWSIHREDDSPPPRDNSGQTQDNSGQTTKKTEATTIPIVQPIVEKNSGKTQDNSGKTQDSYTKPESITITAVQQIEMETQDIQDSFAAIEQQLVDTPLSGKENNEATPNFDVLNCPELKGEAQKRETVSLSSQDKTQGECPETVLSCPELEAITPSPVEVEIPLPIYRRSDGTIYVDSPQLDDSFTHPVVTQQIDSSDIELTTPAITPLEQLINCLAGVITKEQLEAVTAGQSLEMIQDAIDLQNTPIQRQHLRELMNLR